VNTKTKKVKVLNNRVNNGHGIKRSEFICERSAAY